MFSSSLIFKPQIILRISARGIHNSSGLLSGKGCESFIKDGFIKSISLNNPKTRNSLGLEMLKDLTNQIQDISNEIRVVTLGSPHKVFSGGHNLKEMTESQELNREIFSQCNLLMTSIQKCPVPVIGILNSGQIAAAAGCQVMAACDILIAHPSSSFSTPGAQVGLFCSTPGVPLSRNVPRKISAYMLMTGLPINGAEAYNAGLVSRLGGSDEEIQEILNEICEAIKSKPRGVVDFGKKFYHKQMDMDYNSALDHGGSVMVENLNYQDCQEGIQAFKEKRKPNWSHTHEKID